MARSRISPRRFRPFAVRLPLVAVLFVATTAGILFVTNGTARASSAGAFVSDANSARASHGLSGLSVAGDLSAVAQSHARAMANSGSLYHNSSLGSDVCCWTSIGENVGEGSSESQVQSAFMNSAPHRDNILSSAYTQIGVGTATDSHGTLWVDEVFRQPTGSSGAHRISTTHHYVTSTHNSTTHYSGQVAPRPARPVMNLLAVLARRLHVAAADRGHPVDPVAAAYAFTKVMAQLH